MNTLLCSYVRSVFERVFLHTSTLYVAPLRIQDVAGGSRDRREPARTHHLGPGPAEAAGPGAGAHAAGEGGDPLAGAGGARRGPGLAAAAPGHAGGGAPRGVRRALPH